MKNLFQFVRSPIKRREFMRRLGGWGLTLGALRARWGSLSAAPAVPPPLPQQATSSTSRVIEGTGGELLVEQLSALGVEYLFNCESSGTATIWECLVERDDVQVITAVHEGAVASMAYGYALTSGKIPFTLCDSAGFLNKMCTMHAANTSRTPVVFATERQDSVLQGGLENFEDYDEFLEPAAPLSKWRWSLDRADRIPEMTRRAFQFAANPPGGPTVLGFPKDVLSERGVRAEVYSGPVDTAPPIAPAPALIEQAARLLVEAKNPLLFVGPEITKYGANEDVVELAELLGLPVCFQRYTTIYSDFPSNHPLFLGQLNDRMRYPRNVDLFLNIGARMPFERFGDVERGTRRVHVTTDAAIVGRERPAEVAVIADAKLATRALIDAVGGMLSRSRLASLSSERVSATRDFVGELKRAREMSARYFWENSPLSWERLVSEMEQVLDEDAIVVQEIENHDLTNWMTFAPDKKKLIGLSESLGTLGVGGALGAKLAEPDRQVVVMTGDGGFLFGQAEMLWSLSRHKAPVMVVVLNNRSYDHSRTRKLIDGPRQIELRQEMTSYLGDPDVRFTTIAEAFGVKAERVSEPGEIRAALQRGVATLREGEPFLLEVLTQRRGLLADSTWYPRFHIADMRRRKV